MRLSIIAAEIIAHPAGATLEPHRHATCQLSIVLEGTLKIIDEEGWWLVPMGLAAWVPPETSHGSYYSESSRVINLRFDPSVSSRVSRPCESIYASNLLRELGHALTGVLSPTSHGHVSADSERETALMAELTIMQLIRPSTGSGLYVPQGRDYRLRHATNLIRLDPGSSLTIEQLADKVHTSTRTLARLFMAETGMTFGRWRDHVRIVEAVDRLVRGVPISRIAMDLGYSSASSFTTLFTRILGLPPRRYLTHLKKKGMLYNNSKLS